jgi:hypothetical protein
MKARDLSSHLMISALHYSRTPAGQTEPQIYFEDEQGQIHDVDTAHAKFLPGAMIFKLRRTTQ